MNALKDSFFAEGMVDDCPVYDMHGHMGPWYGIHFPLADTESMVRAMTRAGVRLLVFTHHTALFAPEIGNRASIEAVRKFPAKLRAYCAINPNYPDLVRQDLDSYDEYSDVYLGFKFLADYHGYLLTDDRYKPAWEMADAKGTLVLLHTWGSSGYNGAEQVRKVAEKYSGCHILLGHSLYGEWGKAVELAQEFPHVYLELTAVLQERGHLEQLMEAGSEKIIFGTDFPWFDHRYYIGALLGARITDQDRRNILSGNARRLLSKLHNCPSEHR